MTTVPVTIVGAFAAGLILSEKHFQEGGPELDYAQGTMRTHIVHDLGVTGATSLGNTLDVTGATTLNNTLGVAGNATFANALLFGLAGIALIAPLTLAGFYLAGEVTSVTISPEPSLDSL